MRLLELVVVIALIGLIGGAMGIHLHSNHREAQYQEALKGIASKIELAQEVQLAFDADVILHFTPHKKGLRVQMEVECDLPDSLLQLTRPTYFSGINEWEPNEIRFPNFETPLFDP